MNIKYLFNGIKIDGQLYKGSWSRGGYITDHKTGAVCYETVTFYAKGYKRLPACGLNVQNDTDITTDYIENDRIRFTPDHPAHKEAVEAWKAQETRNTKRTIAKIEQRAAAGTPKRYDTEDLADALARLVKLSAIPA